MDTNIRTAVEFKDGTTKDCLVSTASTDLVGVERHFKGESLLNGLRLEHLAFLTWKTIGNGQTFDDWLGTVAVIRQGEGVEESDAEAVPTSSDPIPE